jgi:diguanylate cyclase (GGDEF)-like protein
MGITRSGEIHARSAERGHCGALCSQVKRQGWKTDMHRVSTESLLEDEVLEPLLHPPPDRGITQARRGGWRPALAFAFVGACVSALAVVAVPPADSVHAVLLALALMIAAAVAGTQRIQVDHRTFVSAPSLVYIATAAILLGPAAAAAVAAIAALAASLRIGAPGVVAQVGLAALVGSVAGLVAHAMTAESPTNILLVTAAVAGCGAASLAAAKSVVVAVRRIARYIQVATLTSEAAEFVFAFLFCPALVTLYKGTGLAPTVLFTAGLSCLFGGFGLYRTRLVTLHQEAERRSRTDPLTGAANLRAFDDRLEQELARSARNRLPVGLLLIDVDHFKQVNDTHGHATGDSVLREVCGRLTARLRREDLLSRVGGDEFAAIITGVADGHALQQVADELCQTVRENTISGRDEPVTVTVSIGGATSTVWPEPNDLRRAADSALYTAKAQRRNCGVVTLDPTATQSTQHLQVT